MSRFYCLWTAQVLQGRTRDIESITGVINGGDVDRFGRLAVRVS
jgi:hypothetical protein